MALKIRQRAAQLGMSALGHKRTCGATSHVRFTPKSDRKSGPRQNAVSALPLKADVCGATSDVGFGPIADIELFDHLVGAPDKCVGNVDTERLGGLQVDVQLDFSGLLDR